jgi:hypothetical protein
MKGDHGSSIFNRQVVYYLNLLTFSRKRVTGRINGYPFPPFQPSWAEPPSLPPGVRAPPHANHGSEASLREIVLQPLIRGQRPRIGLEDVVGTILGLSAPLYEVGQLCAGGRRRSTGARQRSASMGHLRKTRAGRYNQDAPWRAGTGHESI